jgi:small-conductance mechanosensitive channel
LQKYALIREVPEKRIFYISKVFEILFIFLSIILLFFVWSVDIKSVALFASSFFAIVGVALFAQWSILSNVTASIIIFFNFPARIGDKIKIVDGDNSVEGIIREISLFQIELVDSDENIVFYPNNLILQKPVVKLKNNTVISKVE